MEELIYCQRDIPQNRWRYGFRASAATGCGWIATYNALRLLGVHAEPEELIRFYERQVLCFAPIKVIKGFYSLHIAVIGFALVFSQVDSTKFPYSLNINTNAFFA